MCFADDAEPAVVELLGDPQLPQRPAVLQRHRQHLVSQTLKVAMGCGQDVIDDVELQIIDPDRVAEAERHVREPLAIARRTTQPAGDVRPDLLEAGARSVRARRELRRPPDVHRSVRRLERQKRGVER